MDDRTGVAPVPTVARPGDAPIRWRNDHAGLIAGAVLAAACFLLGWLRYHNHWADAYDIGLFDQGVWLLSKGQDPQLTVIGDHLFADHLSPVLLVFAPLYRITASPLWMSLAQDLAIGASVLPLRSLARDMGVAPRWASIACLGSAPLLSAAAYDFHPVVLTLPVVASAIVSARRDDVRRCTIAAILVGLLRADAAILLLGVAVIAAPAARRRLITLAVPILGLGLVVPMLMGSDQTFTRYYASLGSSPLDAAIHPWRILTTLGSPMSLERLVIWLAPGGFLLLYRPRWLLALAVGGLPLLLSSNPATATATFHHAATISPFVIAGALDALSRRGDRWTRPAILVTGLAIALALNSPISPETPAEWNVRSLTHDRGTEGLSRVVSLIDGDDRVVADPFLVPPLAHREEIYPWRCQPHEGDACPVATLDPDRFDVVVTTTDRASGLDRRDWLACRVGSTRFVVARPNTSTTTCPRPVQGP